jgi:hypothetical protein
MVSIHFVSQTKYRKIYKEIPSSRMVGATQQHASTSVTDDSVQNKKSINVRLTTQQPIEISTLYVILQVCISLIHPFYGARPHPLLPRTLAPPPPFHPLPQGAAHLPHVITFTKETGSLGTTSMKATLGGKGANLCEMARIGLNVPPGFTITTDVCQDFARCGSRLPEGLWEDVMAALKVVEEAYGAKFADPDKPLLLSVRSGAAVSMPGMMDTVLNLGLNDTVVEGFAKATNERFALDCYRRLVRFFI